MQNFTLFSIILIVIAALALLGLIILTVVIPFLYGSGGRRVFRAAFSREVDTVMDEASPLVFLPKKWCFALIVYIICAIGFLVTWFSFATGLLLENALAALGVMFLLSAFAGLILWLADQYFARVYVFPNKIIRHNIFGVKELYFCSLDCLNMKTTRMCYAGYDTYAFIRDGQRVLRLSTLVFNNLVFLETVFTDEHPYVEAVVHGLSTKPDTAAKA